jgi:hypothetical protein
MPNQKKLTRVACGSINSVAFNDTPQDLVPLDHFPSETQLLFGIIYSHDYALETLNTISPAGKRFGLRPTREHHFDFELWFQPLCQSKGRTCSGLEQT